MRAIRVNQFGGPEELRLEDVPDPTPGPGQIVVAVRAAGVNPVETYIRSGKYPVLPDLPYTPGQDAAGTVIAAGPGVDRFRTGDHVYVTGSLTGTYAEQTLCEQAQVQPLPESISFAKGASIGVPAGAAWRALFRRGGARAGEVVLIHGATGGVGTAAVQFARTSGLTIVATAGDEHGRELARSLGAQHVAAHDITNYPEQLRDLTGGRGVDLIIEMLANENLAADLGVLNKHGRVVIVGSRGPAEIDPRAAMGPELSILGMTINAATPEERASMYSDITKRLNANSFRPVVDREIPLEEAPRAHKEVMEGGKYGKIVLGIGYWVLGVGYWVLGVGYGVHPLVRTVSLSQ